MALINAIVIFCGHIFPLKSAFLDTMYGGENNVLM